MPKEKLTDLEMELLSKIHDQKIELNKRDDHIKMLESENRKLRRQREVDLESMERRLRVVEIKVGEDK